MNNFISNFIDNIILKQVLKIEKNRDASLRFNDENAECEFNNDIVPIITKYEKLITKSKKESSFIFKDYSFSNIEMIMIHAFTGYGSRHINIHLSNNQIKCLSRQYL